eukprot:9282006-Pyramimonas_sp.AAC.1
MDLLRLPYQVQLDIYIDDNGISSSGSGKSVVSSLRVASGELLIAFEEDMESQISVDKAAMISSVKWIGLAVKSFLGRYGGPSDDCRAAVNLGIDDGAGQARRARGRG